MTLRVSAHPRLLPVVVGICLAILFVVNVAAVGYAAHQSSDRRADIVESCERGNVIRAALDDVIRKVYPDNTPTLGQIDCEQIVR